MPTDRDFFTINVGAGSLPPSAFLGLADLGTDTTEYVEFPDLYETDGDNYLDICLRMNE